MKYCIYCGDVAKDHSCPGQILQNKQKQYCTSSDDFDFKPKPKIRKLFKYQSLAMEISKYQTLKIIGSEH